MDDSLFSEHCAQMAHKVATGDKLTFVDLIEIYENVDLGKIDSTFLPDGQTTTGKNAAKRERIFFITKTLWGKVPEYWLELENKMIETVNIDGVEVEKKDLEDLVVPKLLCRLIAVAKYVFDHREDMVRWDAAINQLNSYLFEICTKGNTVMTLADGIPLFPELVDAGIVLSGDKYLPSPEQTLNISLALLRRGTIRPEVYS